MRTETRDYEDAGIVLNSAYMSVLREERDVDLIISLDFGFPFAVLCLLKPLNDGNETSHSFYTKIKQIHIFNLEKVIFFNWFCAVRFGQCEILRLRLALKYTFLYIF